MAGRHDALDGLRALCVGAVMLAGFHWLLPCGWNGVLVFYVLSGFLITRILVEERAVAQSAARFFGRFYFRRALRIFPVYFAYLFALDLVYLGYGVHATWPTVRPYAFGYAINIGMVQGAVDGRAAYGHLWTLSVEEQFYLVWPVVVWLVPRACLGRALAGIVAAGPLFRFACTEWLGLDLAQLYFLSLNHLDAFGAGALVALYDFGKVRRVWPLALGALSFTVALGLDVVWMTGLSLRTLGFPEGLYEAGAHVWGYSLINLTAACCILAIARGELPWLGHPVLAYIGRISYGIYLFQRPILGLYAASIEPHVTAAIGSPALALAAGFAMCAIATIGLAACSYHGFEAPLLRWRDRRVPVRPKPAQALMPGAPALRLR